MCCAQGDGSSILLESPRSSVQDVADAYRQGFGQGFELGFQAAQRLTEISSEAHSDIPGQTWSPEMNNDRYNIAAVRALLGDGMREPDIRSLCQERSEFRPLLRDISSEASLTRMIELLVEFCQKRLLFPELLSEIQGRNPRQFARYRPKLFINESS